MTTLQDGPGRPALLVFMVPCVSLGQGASVRTAANVRRAGLSSEARPCKTWTLLPCSLGPLAVRKARPHVLVTPRTGACCQ